MFVLQGDWWTFLLRGVLAVLFGLALVLLPGIGLLTLIFLFALFTITEGILTLINYFQRRKSGASPPGGSALQGFFSILVGVVAVLLPGITALALLFVIAAWAILTGILHIAAAIRLRKEIRGEWMLVLSGVVAIIFGVLVALFPAAGALVMVLWIGAFAIVFGGLLIALGIKLRRMEHGHHPPGDTGEPRAVPSY